MKTKKTLAKRMRVTKTGKVVVKQSNTGHLKRKWSAARKSRKSGRVTLAPNFLKTVKQFAGKKKSKKIDITAQ